MKHSAVRRLAIALACAAAWSSAAPAVSRAAASPPAVTLRCADAIATADAVPGGYSVRLGRVALPTGRVLGTKTTGKRDPGARLFAKHGLLVRPGRASALVVPDAWKGRLSIEWGSSGRRTGHLRIPRCPAPGNGARWLVFAGGFYVARKACVPLRVKAGTASRTVHIAIGKRCAA
jgi:hypothetical protein